MKDDALLIIDPQKDFCPGGALAVPEGDQVIEPLNRCIETFRGEGCPIFVTRDWHPAKTIHFREHGGQWPPHCVQETTGAEFHDDLKLGDDAVVVSCGTLPDEEGYSGFEGRDPRGVGLADALREKGVTRIFVGGLATDYCVKATVLDGLERGFSVVLIEDAVRGVEVHPGDSQRAVEAMVAAGAAIRSSRKPL